MAIIAPRKGRPTPKAPQNRPKAGPGPATTPSLEDRLARMTPEQRERFAAEQRYRAYRRQTAPFRRAFSGSLRGYPQLARDAYRRLLRDQARVARLVKEELGGVEDVRTIAQLLGMPQKRVQAVLASMTRRAEA